MSALDWIITAFCVSIIYLVVCFADHYLKKNVFKIFLLPTGAKVKCLDYVRTDCGFDLIDCDDWKKHICLKELKPI